MLPKDTLTEIQSTAVAAQSAKVVPIPGDERKVIITCGGAKEFYDLPPKRRDHATQSLESLVDVVKDHSDNAASTDGASVWHSHERITAILNDDDRRDTATFALDSSRPFKAIAGMESKQFTQADLVRLLRVDLAGCVDPLLVKTMRTLNFTGSKATQSDIQHDKSSLGRSVEAKVSGASALPEEFDVTCEVYANHGTGAQTFRIALEIDFEREAFRLTPLHDCKNKNVAAAQQAIHDELLESLGEGTMVYFGTP